MKGRLLSPILLLVLTSCDMASKINESTNAIYCNSFAIQNSTEVIRSNTQLIEESTKVMEENHRHLESASNG